MSESLCELCGNPMPPGEEMFKFHGYSCDCPPKCPPCPPNRRPHWERVRDIDRLLQEGKTGAICIDDTPEHRAWYLHELTKYPHLKIVDQGDELPGVYVIKVRKEPPVK